MPTSEAKLACNNMEVIIAALNGLRLIRENGGYGSLELVVEKGIAPCVKTIIRQNLGAKETVYSA